MVVINFLLLIFMDLFDDLPPPKETSELSSNGKASSGSTESNVGSAFSRKRLNPPETIGNEGTDIEPTRKRLASGKQYNLNI